MKFEVQGKRWSMRTDYIRPSGDVGVATFSVNVVIDEWPPRRVQLEAEFDGGDPERADYVLAADLHLLRDAVERYLDDPGCGALFAMAVARERMRRALDLVKGHAR